MVPRSASLSHEKWCGSSGKKRSQAVAEETVVRILPQVSAYFDTNASRYGPDQPGSFLGRLNPTIPKGRWSASSKRDAGASPSATSRWHRVRKVSGLWGGFTAVPGSANPLAGWRHVGLTSGTARTKEPLCPPDRWLVDEAYPDVAVVRVVLDNRPNRKASALAEAFPLA